jgi:hypothetical protein
VTQRARVRLALASTAVAIAACRSAATTRSSPVRASSAAESRAVAGTYHVALCRDVPCTPDDSTTAYLLATVVLLDSAGAVAADMSPTRQEPPDRRATGCMVVNYFRPVRNSYAGISRREYFIWRDSADYIYFQMFQSPDAGYLVRAHVTASGLAGVGLSWGVMAAEIQSARDTVIATRTGPGNRLWCHAPEPRDKR